MEKILNQIKLEIDNTSFSHAYLIESNEPIALKQLAENVFTEIMKKKDNGYVFTYNDQNLKIITPENNIIKKDQISEFLMEFNKKSLNNQPLVYIIENIEKMNKQSSNALLKFLEEPYENVVGILTTTNKAKVLDTIISRCRNYSFFTIEKGTDIERIEEFIKNCNNNNINIAFFEEEIKDRYLADTFFEDIELYYEQQVQKQEEFPMKLIEIIFDYKNRIKYNTSLKLLFEAFIIEFSNELNRT